MCLLDVRSSQPVLLNVTIRGYRQNAQSQVRRSKVYISLLTCITAREAERVLVKVSATYMESTTAMDDQIVLVIADRVSLPLTEHQLSPNPLFIHTALFFGQSARTAPSEKRKSRRTRSSTDPYCIRYLHHAYAAAISHSLPNPVRHLLRGVLTNIML